MKLSCKQCKKEIEKGMEKKVADWDFCGDCFQELLNKPEKELEPEPEPFAENEKIPCHLCKKELTDKTRIKSGIWYFCSKCHTGLNFTSKKKSDLEQEEKELTPEEANTGSPEIILNPRHDFMKSEQCNGCGRDMPVGGGRDFEGKNLCPECYYSQPDEI